MNTQLQNIITALHVLKVTIDLVTALIRLRAAVARKRGDGQSGE